MPQSEPSIFAGVHRYFINTPWWVQRLFSGYTWRLPAADNTVYLTFDDGPHPRITPWVLDQLRAVNATASFFCIGENVRKYPAVFQRILAEGHAVGNHTQHHCNGWKTGTATYLADVAEAARLIQSPLFRPPYGRIRRAQAKGLAKAMQQPAARVVMWDVLSADFDTELTAAQCAQQVLRYARGGSVVVFHDSEKAFPRLEGCLPAVLAGLVGRGLRLQRLPWGGA